MKTRRFPARRLSVALAVAIILGASSGPARATWSIIAVDRDTGQVGIAGASCTYNVHGIGNVVPGKGAVVVQAMSNDDAREYGVELMRQGSTPEEVVAAMRDGKFDPENQQYGVVSLDPGQPAATYSGTSTSPWRGAVTGDGVAVQGNILVGKHVVTAALDAFKLAKNKSLSERLMKALLAGAVEGGDKRCGDQAARSAFLTVANTEDDIRRVYLRLVVYGIEKGGQGAVDRLATEFRRWRKIGIDHKSTRLYVEP